MKLGSHIKKNLFLSFPIMLSQLGHITVGVVDSIMVGKIGVTQLASVSLSNSLFGFILLFCIGLSYGITPLISSANNNQKYISRIFFHGIIMNMIFTIFLVLLVINLKNYLLYLGQDNAVLNYAFPYFIKLRLRCYLSEIGLNSRSIGPTYISLGLSNILLSNCSRT